MLKPLSEPGVPFTEAVTVDHAITSLFVLPEGGFYTVESLVLDATTGVPLRPLVDYMYFQQDVMNSLITSKQIATIIQLRNKSITNVVVKGKYSHGITQQQLDEWNAFTIVYKDVPQWMNWIACLDDPLQVHPNVKRTVTAPSMALRNLCDVEVELNYIADQFEDGDGLYIPHIEYWQQQVFQIVENQYNQATTDLQTYLNNLYQDVSARVGDFKFTDGDGVKWSNGKKNQFHGITLRDRGTDVIGTYKFLPEGSAIPARRTNLFQHVNNMQVIRGNIVSNKTVCYPSDTIQLNVMVLELVNRVSKEATVQVIDTFNETLLKEYKIVDFKAQTYGYAINLADLDLKEDTREIIIRVPEYMWLNPVIIKILPSVDPLRGRIDVQLLGLNNVGVVDGGGYVDEIKVKFKREGNLTAPVTLYVHLSGDFTTEDIKPGYPPLQKFVFQPNFTESTEVVAEFVRHGEDNGYMTAHVSVSESQDPDNTQAIVKENTWYITKVPSDPYIGWYFATKTGNSYTRIGSIAEGNKVFCVGTLSVDVSLYGILPQLTVVSSGVGSAIEGVDFNINRSNPIIVNNETVAYEIDLPLKPEQEIDYKFLKVKTTNSNTAELWITDVNFDTAITAYWSNKAIIDATATDWVSESSTFYLHVSVPGVNDGTVLNLSLSEPELYRPYLTYPSTVTIFGGKAIVELTLDAPDVANPAQFIKMHFSGPGINYTTLGVRVLDTKRPTYEIRFIADGVVDALTAYPGSNIQCQVRCIKAPEALARAVMMLSGSAVTQGPDMDFVVPAPNNNILKVRNLDFTDWTDVFVSPTTVKSPMRLDHLTLTADVIFPTTDGVKMGIDSSFTINLRKQ